jgi:hypothetical protein
MISKFVNNEEELHPNYVTGIVDGDGHFGISLSKNSKARYGYTCTLVFTLVAEINSYNKIFIEKVQKFFGGIGKIYTSENIYVYKVVSLKELKTIKAHFEKYSLQSTKQIHFLLWCQVFNILESKEHRHYEGFIKILNIKAAFPKRLSKSILDAHPDVVPIAKDEYKPIKTPLDPLWISGFVQADGTFGLGYGASRRYKLGYGCDPSFRVSQDVRDIILLERIILTLGCGKIRGPYSDRAVCDIHVKGIKYISDIIIPFFNKYPLHGAKSLDFQSFCRGISIIENKGHLTQNGLDQLKSIAFSMNSKRKFNSALTLRGSEEQED